VATRIVYADGPSSPRLAPRDALRLAGLAGPPDVLLGWTVEQHPWLGDPSFRAATVLAGYGLARAVDEGRVTPLPVRLSAVAAMLTADPPDLAVVAVVRRGHRLAFSRSVGWADVLARVARRVVVEIDEHGVDLGGPDVDGNVVAEVARQPAAAGPTFVSRAADELDLRIGAAVASLVPEDATLQFGPGGIGEGIARALERPVRIWSGLLTESMAELHERDLLLDSAVAAYTWGGASIERLHASGRLQLTTASVTHDLSVISAIPRFVACNTALQVGLDGSVNVERVGRRVIAAVGGHADFSVGASRSVGGCSIVALRSTTRIGDPTIVPQVDVASTPRSDVDVIVTEHGVADLRGVGDAERGRRIAALAAPEHRSALQAEAAARFGSP
jgi:acyl-CoA hydrolase